MSSPNAPATTPNPTAAPTPTATTPILTTTRDRGRAVDRGVSWWLPLMGNLLLVATTLALPGAGTALEAAAEAGAHAAGRTRPKRGAGGPRVIYG